MRCPYCKDDNDRVIDSRASADGFAIRRRRACRACTRRYTTYERVEGAPLRVVKKSGERAEFDRRKIMAGMTRACEKRPVRTEDLEAIVDYVERQSMEAFDKEVPSKVLGELIMQKLRHLDQVAYVRFASVYREFKDVHQFLEELKPMLEKRSRRDGDTATKDTATKDTATKDTATKDTAAKDTAATDTAATDTAAKDTAAKDTAAKDTAAPLESTSWAERDGGGIHEETSRVSRPET